MAIFTKCYFIILMKKNKFQAECKYLLDVLLQFGSCADHVILKHELILLISFLLTASYTGSTKKSFKLLHRSAESR